LTFDRKEFIQIDFLASQHKHTPTQHNLICVSGSLWKGTTEVSSPHPIPFHAPAGDEPRVDGRKRAGSYSGEDRPWKQPSLKRCPTGPKLAKLAKVSGAPSKLRPHQSGTGVPRLLRAAFHLEAGPIRCVRGLKFTIVLMGQKAQIGPNPFTPTGRPANWLCKRLGILTTVVIGQKAQIGPNPFTPRGRADLVV
jgi:hypothetical protein